MFVNFSDRIKQFALRRESFNVGCKHWNRNDCIELVNLTVNTHLCGSLSAPSIHNHLEAYSFIFAANDVSFRLRREKSVTYGSAWDGIENMIICMIVKYGDCSVTVLIIMVPLSDVFQPENGAMMLKSICLQLHDLIAQYILRSIWGWGIGNVCDHSESLEIVQYGC